MHVHFANSASDRTCDRLLAVVNTIVPSAPPPALKSKDSRRTL
uniref:Uncharacterized protein n=1 Tax=Arundo donax TaxID=35708 RepID=A0A0A9AWK0_ARUDO